MVTIRHLRDLHFLSTLNLCNFVKNWHKTGVLAMNSSTMKHHMQRGEYAHTNKPFTVFIEGNIGSGKTTFLSSFSPSEAHVLSEPVDLWRNLDGHNLLGLLYDDPKRWGFLFQSYVQLTMLDLHLSRSHHPLKLMERSINSARFCFVENLHRSKTISDAELSVLDHWYSWIQSHSDVSGDLVVYLQTSPEVVYERMKIRNRKEESYVPLSYLQQLHDLHEEWLIHGTHFSKPAQVIVVDANQDLNEMREEFMKVKTHIIDESSRQAQSISI